MRRITFALLAFVVAGCGSNTSRAAAPSTIPSTTTTTMTTQQVASIVAERQAQLKWDAQFLNTQIPSIYCPGPQCTFDPTALSGPAGSAQDLADALTDIPVPAQMRQLVDDTLAAAQQVDTDATTAANCTNISDPTCFAEVLQAIGDLNTLSQKLDGWAPYM